MENWDRPEYRAFRRQFVKRLLGAKAMALSAAHGKGAAEHAPAPELCRTCPKLYGVRTRAMPAGSGQTTWSGDVPSHTS